jgi:hypothetical protein
MSASALRIAIDPVPHTGPERLEFERRLALDDSEIRELYLSGNPYH